MRVDINTSAVRALVREPEVQRRTRQVAESVASAARRKAPVRTGRLRDSIKVIPDPDTPGAYRVVMAWWGIFPEFGTEHESPKPFMRPAASLNK